MKIREYFCFILGFASASVFYLTFRLSATLSVDRRFIDISHSSNLRQAVITASSQRHTKSPTPLPMKVLNHLMVDDCKLKEFFHVDGPLDLTKENLPYIKRSVRATYTRPHRLSNNYQIPTCANSLRNASGPSTWFNQRFNPKLKQFLDKDDINKWDNFYNLSFCPSLPLGLRNVSRRGLIRLVNNGNYSAEPIFGKRSAAQNKCIRCAVVGTSGILKGSNIGSEIDSYEYVFRMNNARLRGFEKDVGSKTSVYAAFPQSIYVRDMINFKDVYFIAPIFTRFMVSWLELFLNDTMATIPKLSSRNFNNGSLFNPRRIRILHPDFLRHFQMNFLNGKGFYPSTGAITAAFALYNCDEIKMFGFGVTSSSFLHYYDSKNASRITKGRTNHNFLNEWELWNMLEENKIVSFYRPNITERLNKTDIRP